MVWTSVNGNPQGTRFDPSPDLTRETISTISEKYKINISSLPDGYADVYTNVTLDDSSIFLTTQAQYDEKKSQVPIGGEIICIEKETGTIRWKKFISEYSGVPQDYSRSAPTVWKNNLLFATGIGVPQSVFPYDATLKNLFTGRPVRPTHTRQSLICVNKNDGSLLWRTFLGKVAKTINDLDNWVYITQAPFVFTLKDCTPVVAIGTSSGQSFQGWFYTNGQPFTGLSLSDQFNFQMTDIGKLYLIHAKTGKILKVISAGPEPLQKGDVCPLDALPPCQDSTLIRYVVEPQDIQPGGVLNPVQKQFAITCPLHYVLETNKNATVPAPLNGITVIGTNGSTIQLIGGEPVTPLMNKVVVATTASFVFGTSTVFINGVAYRTDDPTTGLVGGTGLRPVRIRKVIQAGQVLDEKDAYALNVFGASIWGNSIVVNEKKTRLYFATGQPHAVPISDETFVTDGLPTFLETQMIIEKAQDTYKAFPTEENYAFLQDAYRLYEQVDETTLERKKYASVRYQRFYFCSVVCIDIRPGKECFGNIRNVYSSNGYDFWQYGFTSLFSRGQTNPNGWSDSQIYYDGKVGPDGDFGQGPYLLTIAGEERVVAMTKSGFFHLLDKHLNLIYKKQIGNSVVNGASNYGSTISNGIFGTIITQAYYPSDLNVVPPNFSPQLSWYASETESYAPQQSSFIAIDVATGTILWTRPLILSNVNPPYACSLGQASSTDNFFIVPAADGLVYFIDIQTGETSQTLTLDGDAGQSGTIVVDNTIYAILGRSGLGPFFNPNGAQYGPAKHIFVFSINDV